MEEIKEKKKRGRPAKSGRPKGGNETSIVDPLIHPYKIFIDDRCYTVVDKDKPDTETAIEKSYGYFYTLGGALNKIARLKTTKNKIFSLSEYIKEYKTMIDEFQRKFGF